MNLNLIAYLKNLKKFRATKCGHLTRREGKISAFGQSAGKVQMPLNDEGGVDWCLECIGKMSIKCAWCGDVITIGEPITLYSPIGSYVREEHVVAYKETPLTLVGCLGWDCAETGADRAGFWLPGNEGSGEVFRVPTALETILSSGMKSGVIIEDTFDISKALNPTVFSISEEEEYLELQEKD